METGIEGVGEAVTGGMIARAVEPDAGESDEKREGTCLNCGAALAGPYCHQCGQKGRVHRTLSAFGHDLLHSVLHFEGKIWRTLPMLAWRPGELTRRYIDGERARFVSPMALFLFSVFLMFAVFGTVGGPFHVSSSAPTPSQLTTELLSEFGRESASLRSRQVTLERQRRSLEAQGLPTGRVNEQLGEIRNDLAAMEAAQRLATRPQGEPREGQRKTGPPALVLNDATVNTGWPWLDGAVVKAAENPSLLVYKLQSNAYKFSWALIPISVPFVWLMFFWRRRFKIYDHTVFVTYSLAFMTLLTVALSLLLPIVRTEIFAGFALTFIPPVHMYRQLKGAYGLTRFRALWRTFFLLLFATWAATLYFLLLLTMGLLG